MSRFDFSVLPEYRVWGFEKTRWYGLTQVCIGLGPVFLLSWWSK